MRFRFNCRAGIARLWDIVYEVNTWVLEYDRLSNEVDI